MKHLTFTIIVLFSPLVLCLMDPDLVQQIKMDGILKDVWKTTSQLANVLACRSDGYEFDSKLTGEISTPSGPGYINGASCAWTIKTTKNMILQLNFEEFSIPSDEFCFWGYLEVFDGNKFSSKMEDRKLCGQLRNTTFVTSSNTAVVTYYANGASKYRNFRLKWTSLKRPSNQHKEWEKCGLASRAPAYAQLFDYNRMLPVTSNEGSWPWHAGLVVKGSYQKYCQGTVISSKFVLTAAHCVEELEKGDFEILVGKHLSEVWEPTEQRFAVAEINLPIARPWTMLLEGFKKKLLFNSVWSVVFPEMDISVVELKGEITFTPYVRPICMPSLPPKSGNDAMAIGWNIAPFETVTGKMKQLPPVHQELKEILVEISDQELCDSLLAISDMVTDENHGVICTASGRQISKTMADTGQGDSGGGMFERHEGRWVITGVLNSAISLNLIGKVNSQWSSVHHHLTWIKIVTRNTVN